MNVFDELIKSKPTPTYIQSFSKEINKQENNKKEHIVQDKNRPSNQERNYIYELKAKLIRKLKARYLNNSKPDKKYFSATEITNCPKLLWYQLKGMITDDMLDSNKLFYLLDVYGVMGTTVHNYIYKTLDFEFKEEHIIDYKNHISGKFDIFDNGILIDIKSSQNITDVSPQLSIYYYLLHIFQKRVVKKVFVWWVLKDKLEELEISKLENLFPIYINRANLLYDALKLDKYPEDKLGVDKNGCKYCPIETWCKNSKQKVNKTTSTIDTFTVKENLTEPQKDDSDIKFLL